MKKQHFYANYLTNRSPGYLSDFPSGSGLQPRDVNRRGLSVFRLNCLPLSQSRSCKHDGFFFFFFFASQRVSSKSAFDLPSQGFTASQLLQSCFFDKSIQSLWFPFCWACWKPVGRHGLPENEQRLSAHVTWISHGSSRLPTLLWAVEGQPGKPGPQVGRGTGGHLP